MQPGELSEWFLGYEVVLKTVRGTTVTGVVWGFDKASDTVIISSPSESGQPGNSTVRVMKVAFIKEIESSQAPTTPFDATLPAYDLRRVEAREAKLVQRALNEAAAIGVGVTKEAQAVFDVLNKTMDCRWLGTTIEVMAEVEIAAPYGASDCKLKQPNGNASVLERVGHILEAERSQLGV